MNCIYYGPWLVWNLFVQKNEGRLIFISAKSELVLCPERNIAT